MDKGKTDFREHLLFFAWAVSVIATLGSLYFSEILKYPPCEICWFIRILMYPLVIILGVAIVKKDYKAALYSVIFSGIGIPVAIYLYLIQKVPTFSDSVPACGLIPCSTEYINWLGFITIPFLALTAFIIIFICSFIILKRN
ncbi:MAG TPA: disulfide oxidoreductase [Bacillaceae bacterium]|nr:disulfide oxidoreductase [Paenibacillus bovis]HLU21445.1 disulfide oxidoreductase [Bacillaceae bacterium]